MENGMNTGKRRPGRPPALSEEKRRERILAAAEGVFSEVGYGAASMEEIARRSQMSKKTVYQLFPDKEAIFTTLIFNYEDTPQRNLKAGMDFRTSLSTSLLEMATFTFSPRQVAMTRLVISEARHSPELAQRFYENCLQRVNDLLVGHLTGPGADHPLKTLDIPLVADMLFGATIGALHLRVLVKGLEPEFIQKELETRIQLVIDLILGPR